MINAAIFIGEPLFFKDKIKIYPPKVKDVIANPKFGLYAQILTISDEDLRDELLKGGDIDKCPSPFEFILANCYNDKRVNELTIEAFELFCHTKIVFLFEEKQIAFVQEDDVIQTILTEEDFFDFQNLIRESMGDKPIKPLPPIDPNEDPRIRRMKEKIRERDRLKAKAERKGRGSGISLEVCLTAICCMGLGITPLNIGEMSYASIGPIMKMMQEKEKYDIDIRSLLAGASSKKIKPKYWIREEE